MPSDELASTLAEELGVSEDRIHRVWQHCEKKNDSREDIIKCVRGILEDEE